MTRRTLRVATPMAAILLAVPAVSSLSNAATLPKVSLSVPKIATPSVTVPSVTVPGVKVPSVTVPSVTVPA